MPCRRLWICCGLTGNANEGRVFGSKSISLSSASSESLSSPVFSELTIIASSDQRPAGWICRRTPPLYFCTRRAKGPSVWMSALMSRHSVLGKRIDCRRCRSIGRFCACGRPSSRSFISWAVLAPHRIRRIGVWLRRLFAAGDSFPSLSRWIC